MSRFDNKVFVVTGGASGIGEATTRGLVAEGGRVVVADLQVDCGEALASELAPAVVFIQTDVTREEDIENAVTFALERFSRLDGMVNNAGIVGAVGSIRDTSIDAYEHTMAILSRAVFLGMKHAGRVLCDQGSGAIVSLASTAGVMGALGPHVYTMAKHGVVGLTRSAAAELSRHGIRVNAVAPGGTVTPMTAALTEGDSAQIASNIAAESALGFAPDAQDMANAILFALGEESRYMTGHTLVVDAGQTTGSSWRPMFFDVEPGMI